MDQRSAAGSSDRLHDLDGRLAALADRLEVTDVITRFHRAVDRSDWALLRDEVLAPDAVWEWTAINASGSAEDRAVGRESVVAWLSEAIVGSKVRHFTTSHLIELDGDRAHSESYMVVVDAVSLAVLANGLLTADHVRLAEGWRMQRCHIDERIPDKLEEAVETLMAQRA